MTDNRPRFGLIFDFDGLMIDTEAPVFDAWVRIFAEHGATLTVADWAVCLGAGQHVLDPAAELARRTGREVDGERLYRRHHDEASAALASASPLPGVKALLDAAEEQRVRLAVASSSPRSWVAGHLERLGLLDRFDAVLTSDDVERTKPAPDLFLAALDRLGLEPHEAFVLEDSPNGVAAARAAGIRPIAVPNSVTRQLDLSDAHRIVDSLEDLALQDLMAEAANGGAP